MNEGLSVRKTAARMSQHRPTAFRERHRVLALPREATAQQPSGVREDDETYLRHTYNGHYQRLLADAVCTRRHGCGSATNCGLPTERVPIPVLRTRARRTAAHMPKASRNPCVSAVLKPTLAEYAVLWTVGSGLQATAVGERLDVRHPAVNSARGERVCDPWHIRKVNAYHSRFKGGPRCSNSEATTDFPNFSGWFRALDRNAPSGAKPIALSGPAVDA